MRRGPATTPYEVVLQATKGWDRSPQRSENEGPENEFLEKFVRDIKLED